MNENNRLSAVVPDYSSFFLEKGLLMFHIHNNT